MSPNQKGTRTQITDLPEMNVELSDKEMRVVSGGLKSRFSCYSRVAVTTAMVAGLERTNVATGNDWDYD